MNAATEIAELRGKIDEIDASLMQLLARRFAICVRVGALKEQANMPVMQPNRVAEITERAARMAEGLGLSSKFAEDVWHSIIAEACRLEEIRKNDANA